MLSVNFSSRSPFPIIQVSEQAYWQSQEEPMGSKSKFWIDHPEFGRCLFKFARSNTGEDWAEKMTAELAGLLGLPHADYHLAVTWEGRAGVLSPNFVPEGAILIHGNEVLTPLIPNYPTYATYGATQHTLTLVLSALHNNRVGLPPDWSVPQGIETATDLFIGYLLLDAWIGNGDRHHENWGFVQSPNQSQESDSLYLAPTYDHASSLGRELTDEKRLVRSVAAYTEKCLSAFYRHVEDQKPLRTFDLFAEVAHHHPVAARVWLEYLEKILPEQIDFLVARFPKERFSEISAQFVKQILNLNQKRLLTLKND